MKSKSLNFFVVIVSNLREYFVWNYFHLLLACCQVLQVLEDHERITGEARRHLVRSCDDVLAQVDLLVTSIDDVKRNVLALPLEHEAGIRLCDRIKMQLFDYFRSAGGGVLFEFKHGEFSIWVGFTHKK